MTLIHFIFSAVCIGITKILIDWFFIGYLFHKYQSLTPQTWKPENYSSYIYSSFLSLLFGFLFTFFFSKIGSKYVLPGDIFSALKLGMIAFASFTLITELDNAIYVNYHRKFLAGKLIASCLSYLAAAVIAGLFYWK
jgi:hypothetical protein